ncbi:MAG: hypothetical protein QOC55_1255, partial [Thermoleophilaceae bacterium]|nr:hypothetical protein [Thermoleophilaceae bacterium]
MSPTVLFVKAVIVVGRRACVSPACAGDRWLGQPHEEESDMAELTQLEEKLGEIIGLA